MDSARPSSASTISGTLAPGRSRISLLSLPNELLLQLLREQMSLQEEWRKARLDPHWYTWIQQPCARYTSPWSMDHHCIALPLSQTCRRLRELMLPSIWEDVGINTLEGLAKARDGLRLFPERGELVKRLEWSWWFKNPVEDDAGYCAQHPEITETQFRDLQLDVILQPPYRWPKQPLTTRDECNDAMTEFTCRLVNLDTLLWVSPYLQMQPAVVEFLESKALPLRAFQISLGGDGYRLVPETAAYWRFTGSLVKLSINYIHSRVEKCWYAVDMDRWICYDDELTGLDDYCKEEALRMAGEIEEEPQHRRERALSDQLLSITSTERQCAVAFKILWPAYEGSLRSLAFEPSWVLGTRALSPCLVQLEEILLSRGGNDVNNGQCSVNAYEESIAHLGPDDMDEGELYWYFGVADWHLGARAIRPALYHLARHRKWSDPLTGEEVQTLADKPPVYPASLFYPCLSRPKLAQSMADRWEELVEMGESERVRCTCTECS